MNQYEALAGNPKRYAELVDIYEKLLLTKDPNILITIDKDERLNGFEKIFVAYNVGFLKCNNEIWPSYKKHALDNIKKGD